MIVTCRNFILAQILFYVRAKSHVLFVNVCKIVLNLLLIKRKIENIIKVPLKIYCSYKKRRQQEIC